MDKKELKEFLDEKYYTYNSKSFIDEDPISIPHRFSLPRDIEIAGFIAATFAWGQRKTIINKSLDLIRLMDNAPYEFLTGANDLEKDSFMKFVHRTFSGTDCVYFLKALRNIYKNNGGIGEIIQNNFVNTGSLKHSLITFRNIFLSFSPETRTCKHIANIEKGVAGKRLNMYLRWMVRKDGPVDFGLWKKIPSKALYMPLDLHTSNVSRKLGLLSRKHNDWKAVEELTDNLKKFDPHDPVKYDFALFGLGIYEGF